jgi:serine protease Do
MRRWQVWFFGRSAQIVFWVAILVVGWFLVRAGTDRARWWWPFERSAPAVVLAPSDGSAPSSAWTVAAKAAMPAVVNIASARTVRGPEGPPAPFFSDPFFRFFFGPEPAPRRERSLGSGVIVTPDGYVLTNHHVVEGAQDIRATLADRREFRATLIGADPKTDLAVLKLAGSGFPVVPFGDSSRVEVAEVVLAIGNPFGLSQTVTMGIVSAVGRANVGISDYEDFIQTDAAINPGNSGGALVSARGALIGINTAIFTQSGGYMGIGFAVPVNMARPVMDQLVTRRRVIRGYLGVTVQDLTPAVARGLGVSADRGVLVADVTPGSPAQRAGLQRGDVITAIDGKAVDDSGHFRNIVAGTAPGSRVRLTVVRSGAQQIVEVAVAELADREQAARPSAVPAPTRERPGPLGLALVDATPETSRTLGLGTGFQGAIVADVAPGGQAAEAGLRPGDVVLEVNRRPVRSARDVIAAVQQAGDSDVVLLVNRRGSTTYVAIERGP